MIGDLGLTFLAAAISCSWFTSSVIDNLSSGFTFKVEPKNGDSDNINPSELFSQLIIISSTHYSAISKHMNRVEKLLNQYLNIILIIALMRKKQCYLGSIIFQRIHLEIS